MSGHIVYEGVSRSHGYDSDDINHEDTLFAGQKLWFAHAIPQRKWLMENAQRNGAIVVDRDVEADVRLVDHAKKNNAPSTHSYKYVEASIRNGTLEDLASHVIGAPSRVSRPVGSSLTAPKTGRTPFTPEDDQLLWNWITPFAAKGGTWKGNEIYKQLEAANPRHTFQSWRDRWMKHTQYQKRQVTEDVEPQDPRTTPSAANRARVQTKRPRALNDDGEAERGPQDPEELTRPTPSIRSPARRILRAPYHTYEDSVEDIMRAHANKLSHKPERRLVEKTTSSKLQSREARATPSRSGPPPSGGFEEPLTSRGAHRETHGQEQAQSASDTTSAQGEISCAICFTTEASKWRQDNEGRLLCPACTKLVKVHGGFRRASIAWNSRRETGDSEDASTTRQRLGEKQSSRATFGHDNRDKHATLSNDDVGLSRRSAHQTNAQPSREIRSPSYRPQSPTLVLPEPKIAVPEPNIGMKRIYGRSTESQSTQPSNASTGNSQDTHTSNGSQPVGHPMQESTAIMGAEQSTESGAGVNESTVDVQNRASTVAPSFQAISRGKRKRLQDEPTVLPSQQDSSLSTDGAPAGQRSVHLSTNSDKDRGHDSVPTTLPTPTSPSGRFETQAQETSWLFVPEGNDAEEYLDSQVQPSTENDRSSSPAQVELVSEGIDINVDSQSTSGRDNEEVEDDVDADFDDLVPLNKRQKSEGFETAQETPENYETAREEQSLRKLTVQSKPRTWPEIIEDDGDFDLTELPDPPGGFGMYGVRASVMPPEGYGEDEGEPMNADDTNVHGADAIIAEEREQSPEIKLEDGSCLKPRDQPLLLPELLSISSSEADTPSTPADAHNGAQGIKEEHLQQKKPHDDTQPTQVRNEAQRRRAERLEEDRAKAQREAERQEAQRRNVERQAAQVQEAKRKEAPHDEAPRDEAQREEAQRADSARLKSQRREGERRQDQAQAQGPSSATAVEEPIVATSASEPNLVDDSEYNADEWLEEQLTLYPKVRVLEPILFQAISATGYRDADLTSRVVTIMVEQRRSHIKGILRETGKKALSNAEIDALDHESFVPRNMRRVWTKRDDRDLQGSDEAQNRMVDKHGLTNCKERFDYRLVHY